MEQAGFQFETFSRDIDESIPSSVSIEDAAAYLAKLKNDAYRKMLGDEVILTADTTVLCQGKLLEKPASVDQACNMLRTLSGGFNEVISGVCISSKSEVESFAVTTKVHFKQLTGSEINDYVQFFKPFDKAGAYGIQEWIGLIGITHIEGSYYNVMGLPIDRVYQTLVGTFGIRPVLESK